MRRRFLQPLHKEGAALIDLCWKASPLSSVGSSAATIFDAEGVTAPSDQLRWAARLVLPVFSAPEIEALKSEVARARIWGKRKDRPTPKRLAVWVLANRTGMKANKVASKIGFRERAKYFKPNSNPIKPHSS